MRHWSLWLVFLTSLIVEITANNNSIPSELLYLYYVYKMEYMSADAGARTMALGCEPSSGEGMCFFDDFVKYVMEDRFQNNYRPSSADHTSTPKTSNLANINKALPASARLQISRVFPNVNFHVGPGNSLSYSAFMDTVLDTANTAMDSGKALFTDGQSAQAACQAASDARAPQAYDGLTEWLGDGETLTEAEYELVDVSTKTGRIDWDTTIENINDSDLSDSDKEALKTKLQGISQNLNLNTGSAPLSVRDHDAILKQLQDSVTEIGTALDRADPEITGPNIPEKVTRSRCASDDSSSEEESDTSSESDGDASEKRSINPVLAKYYTLGKRQDTALKKILAGRAGISPISISSSGSPTSSSSKFSSSSSKFSSSSTAPTSSKSSVRTTTTPTKTGPTSTGYEMAVTTVFSAPPGCQGGITEVAEATGVLWQNIINPAPSVTVASCFPSQFVASALATASLPPFSKLVCPDTWGSYDVNSTYAICCPKGFGLYAPNITNTQRPGLNAICTSVVWPSVLMDVTSYDMTSLATVIPETVGANATLVFATAFEGSTFSPVGNATSSVTSTSSRPASVTSTSSRLTSTTTSSQSKPSSTSSLPKSTSTSSSPKSTSTSSQSKTTSTSSRKSTSTTSSTITSKATLPAISSLPSCGQTCMSNMLAQYSALGCGSPDPACLCRNVNFGYGIRDCANGACGTVTGNTVIAFGSSYCAIAEATETTFPVTATPTITAISQLPACGQTCMNNMIGQYSTLGCASPVPSCLCQNVNFGYGIRDCANGACGTAVATTVISFGSAYCASATAS